MHWYLGVAVETPDGSNDVAVYAGVGAGGGLLLIIGIIVVVVCFRRRQYKSYVNYRLYSPYMMTITSLRHHIDLVCSQLYKRYIVFIEMCQGTRQRQGASTLFICCL